MEKKENWILDPENLAPKDRMKYEIAEELGLSEKVRSGGWRSLTAKESGRIGGLMTKKKREMVKEQKAVKERENIHKQN